MRALVRLALYRLFHQSVSNVIGIENVPAHGPYLLAPNHIDYLDGYYLVASLYRQRPDTIHFFAQTNNYWWAGFVHPVRWEDKEATVREAAHLLRKGRVVCNFPEGKRNETDTLLPGKTGTVRMALVANIPIIPVGLCGPAGKNFSDSLRLSRKPAGRTITFGKAFNPADIYGPTPMPEQIEQLTNELMERISAVSGKDLPQTK